MKINNDDKLSSKEKKERLEGSFVASIANERAALDDSYANFRD